MAQKEISKEKFGLMLSTAIFFDTLQAGFTLIPFLGWIFASLVGIFAFMTFWFWFKLYGVKFSTPKRSALMGGGFIIELIPILNALPAWALAVTLVYADTKKIGLGKIVGSIGKDGKSSSTTSDSTEEERRAA